MKSVYNCRKVCKTSFSKLNNMFLFSILVSVLIVMTSCASSPEDETMNTSIDENGNVVVVDTELYNEPETFYNTSRYIMDDSVCEGFNNCQSKILASDDEGSIWSINLQDYSYDSYGGFVIHSEIERICKYSYEGELISYVDVEVTSDLSYRTFAVGSDVYLMLQAYNEDANRFEMTMYQVDFEGGTLIEKSDTELARTLSDSNTTVVGSFVLGDRNVIQIFSVNTGLTLVYVNDDLSYEKRYIGDELYRKHSISDTSAIIYPISDNEILITTSNLL